MSSVKSLYFHPGHAVQLPHRTTFQDCLFGFMPVAKETVIILTLSGKLVHSFLLLGQTYSQMSNTEPEAVAEILMEVKKKKKER